VAGDVDGGGKLNKKATKKRENIQKYVKPYKA
jgi:hypothetical protein